MNTFWFLRITKYQLKPLTKLSLILHLLFSLANVFVCGCVFLVQSFHCKHGKAYLFNKVSNVTIGETEDRMMMTGKHTVADIFCVSCGSIVGWRYETAHEKSQKYKEGKSVLERFKISGPDGSNYWVSSHGRHIGGSDADDS